MNPEARAIDAKPGQAHDQNKSRRQKQTFRIHDVKIYSPDANQKI